MTNFTIALIAIGLLFDLFGCLGLIRFPDVYNRLQSATKCVTLGTCSILLGLFAQYGFTEAGIKAVICIPLLFLTSTVAAHALARGSYISGISLWEKTQIDEYKNEVKDSALKENVEQT